MAGTVTGEVMVYVGLGANLGDALGTLAAAVQSLSELPHTRWLATSPLYRTQPVDAAGPDYLNAVAQLRTSLSAHDLLTALQGIESAHGRERPYRNAPRTLDLDLLLYGDDIIQTPMLTVPHAQMHQRAFVLVPLACLAPDVVVPGRGPVQSLLAGVADQRIQRIDSQALS